MLTSSLNLDFKGPYTWTPINLPKLTLSKYPLALAGDAGFTLGSERSPGEGNGNTLQYSCLENPMHRGTRWDTVHVVTEESDMTE